MANKTKSVFEAIRSILSAQSDAFESVPQIGTLSVAVRNVTDGVVEGDPRYATARQILDASESMPLDPPEWPLPYAIRALEVALNGAPCGYVVTYSPLWGKGVAGIFFGAVTQNEPAPHTAS